MSRTRWDPGFGALPTSPCITAVEPAFGFDEATSSPAEADAPRLQERDLLEHARQGSDTHGLGHARSRTHMGSDTPGIGHAWEGIGAKAWSLTRALRAASAITAPGYERYLKR
jgi:hypothetical protein